MRIASGVAVRETASTGTPLEVGKSRSHEGVTVPVDRALTDPRTGSEGTEADRPGGNRPLRGRTAGAARAAVPLEIGGVGNAARSGDGPRDSLTLRNDCSGPVDRAGGARTGPSAPQERSVGRRIVHRARGATGGRIVPAAGVRSVALVRAGRSPRTTVGPAGRPVDGAGEGSRSVRRACRRNRGFPTM